MVQEPAGDEKAALSANAALSASRTKRYSEVTDKIRQRADLAAKGLATLGTTVLTAIGVAKFGDVFPWPGTFLGCLAFLGLLAGYVSTAGGIAWFTYQLWSVNAPIPTQTNLKKMEDELGETSAEMTIVRGVYEEMALTSEAPSFQAYEARADRLDRVAERVDDAATKLRSEASEIRADVLSVLQRTIALLVRYRATQAIKSRTARRAYGTLVAGVLLFAVAADYMQSERADKIELAKSCAGARQAKANESALPDVCGTSAPTPTATARPTATALSDRQRSAISLERMTKALRECEDSVATPEACDVIRRSIAAAAAGS